LLPSQIRDEDLQHVGTAGDHACNPGTAPGIKLNVTKKLVAPVVVLAHNRPKYLAKTLLQLLRCAGTMTENSILGDVHSFECVLHHTGLHATDCG
jgi:hypothetical protein